MTDEEIRETGKMLLRMTNDFSCRSSLGKLIPMIADEHPTLAQSFVGGFVIPFVREMGSRFRKGDFDGRNEETCRACEVMCQALEKFYDIKEGDELSFRCV